ncbi:MAG: tyrosine-type recombinase/integrase [Candidatus Woesearchaeota archaeon]
MNKNYQISRDKFFDNDEREEILKTCEEKEIIDKAKARKTWIYRYMLVHLALYSGLRVAEIASLKHGDLYLKSKDQYIHVRNGKRNKSRDVYIDKNLVKHLKDFIDQKRIWKHSTNSNAPLFNNASDKHVTTTTLHISFKKAIQEAGLRENLSIHSARHSYATLLYHKTKNLRYVQDQLGHSNIAMTSLYANIFPEEKSSLANMILD